MSGALTAAIERQQWELAALCLLLGTAQVVRSLPPEAGEALIQVLAEENGRRRATRPRRKGRRGRR